jgi:hypothetical protein
MEAVSRCEIGIEEDDDLDSSSSHRTISPLPSVPSVNDNMDSYNRLDSPDFSSKSISVITEVD